MKKIKKRRKKNKGKKTDYKIPSLKINIPNPISQKEIPIETKAPDRTTLYIPPPIDDCDMIKHLLSSKTNIGLIIVTPKTENEKD